jgi:hypothetical protein
MAKVAKLSDPTAAHFLLSHSANIDLLAIFHAIGIRGQRNGTVTLQVLIDYGADIDFVSKRWGTSVYHAGRMGREDQLEMLLNCEADSDVKEGNMRASALELAEEMRRENLFERIRVEGGMGML